MRTRTLGVFAVVCSCAVVSAAIASERADAKIQAAAACGDTVATTPGVPSEVLINPPARLPRGVEIQKRTVYVGEGTVSDGSTAEAAGSTGTLVYSNTLGQNVFGPGEAFPPGTVIADDIATVALYGCTLDRYKVRVSGDKDGDGSGQGPFSANIALYQACPGGGLGLAPVPIAYTAGSADFPDNGVYEVTVIPTRDIALPQNLFVGVSFSRRRCGVVVGAPATVGLSADLLDFPGFPCNAFLGGYPGKPHASFYAEVYTRGACREAFVGYKNTQQAGADWTQGAGIRFADDITLGVPVCNMVAYEIGVKGDGIIYFDLRTSLSNINPETGGRIPGTDRAFLAFGDGVQIARFEFDPPITLQPRIWMTFLTTSAETGPILAGTPAALGATEDLYAWWNDQLGAWVVEPLPTTTYAAFEINIECEGRPEVGACCDMVNRDDGGEAVCRDTPEMNCGFPAPGFWRDNEACGAQCRGGINDGEQCLEDTDCVFCEGGFRHGDPCVTNDECNPHCVKTTCVGGIFDGESCETDSDCLVRFLCNDNNVCEGGPRNGLLCANDNDCADIGVCAGACVGWKCDGGTSAGTACTRQADCPGFSCVSGSNAGRLCNPEAPNCPGGFCRRAKCPGPFAHPCGFAACCTHDDFCFDFTQNECESRLPVDKPRMFARGEFCNFQGFNCPFGACLGRVGDCTLPRPHVCEGGPNDGDMCEFNSECPEGTCEPQPGCGDPFCCSDVCAEYDSFCCLVEWDASCAQTTFTACDNAPSNDECWDPNEGKGARLVAVPSITESDTLKATTNTTDPGFCCNEGLQCPPPGVCCAASLCQDPSDPADPRCCDGRTWGLCVDGERDGKPCIRDPADPLYNAGPGSRGTHSVWYKFIATEPSAKLNTCSSNSPEPGDDVLDSLISVYALLDPDRGICDDLSPCSVDGQDCGDGSACELDERYACENLELLACNDDTRGCSDTQAGSEICLSNLVVGDTYYVLVAHKRELPLTLIRFAYKLTVSSPCSAPTPPQPNDYCQDAIGLPSAESVTEAFDLSGGDDYQPATFHCPGETCNVSMQNDLWYTWTAPYAGRAEITTCDRSLPPDDQPNTTMVVYQGCDCPPEIGTGVIGCNLALFGQCGLASGVRIDVQQGQCYMIRLGGHRGGTPAGDLTVTLTRSLCPDGAVTFDDPPGDAVDARQPHEPTDNTRQGISSFVVSGPAGLDDMDCWSLCETAEEGFPNFMTGITDNGDGTFTVGLGQVISKGAITTLTYTSDTGAIHRGVFTSHPADSTADGLSNGADIDAIMDFLDGALVAPFGVYSCDTDQSDVCAPADILRLIDLLNGAELFDPWNNVTAPLCGDCCLP